jgi:hypothetical protein
LTSWQHQLIEHALELVRFGWTGVIMPFDDFSYKPCGFLAFASGHTKRPSVPFNFCANKVVLSHSVLRIKSGLTIGSLHHLIQGVFHDSARIFTFCDNVIASC